MDSFSEIFPDIVANLKSRVRVSPRSADHLCTVVVHPVLAGTFSGPAMDPENTKVFREISRVSNPPISMDGFHPATLIKYIIYVIQTITIKLL